MSFGGYLKADTESIVTVGPVVAVGDGFTPVTTLALSTADEAELIKHGATTTTDISALTMAAITGADGYYALTLTAAVLDTEGRLTVLINDDSLCLPVKAAFMVVNANVYDSLFAAATTDYLQTDIIQVGGVAEDIATETKQDVIDGNVDSILADTNELQTDLTDGGRLDVILDELTTQGDTNEGKLDTIDGIVDAILDDTGTNGVLLAATATSAQLVDDVNAQVVDVLKTDTIAEMSQGAPPATPTFEEAINYLYRKLRNKTETTATEDAVYDDAGTTKLFKATLSDDTTTMTKEEYISGL